jgi:hypothetical protein
MPSITITHETLLKVCAINQFEVPPQSLIFVGVRGSVLSEPLDQSFKREQNLSVTEVNYINPRCTMLQWDFQTKNLSAFPASTVPHKKNIQKSLDGGDRSNCLLTGFYKDYKKGVHKPGSETAHEAFRQNAKHPFKRTADDLDFDKDDRIEYDNPWDNIHSGWFDGLDAKSFASAGCQVIMGYPKCARPRRTNNTGPWKVFHENAYGIPQQIFPYILLKGAEFESLTLNRKPKAKLRFGSSGSKVKILQAVLKEMKYYQTDIDGDFGETTMKALVAFQLKQFGYHGADGIVGPLTAERLGMDLTI